MALIIFVKNPVLGKVKTRLAATLGDPAALSIYHKLAERTRDVALQVPVPRYLFYSDFIDRGDAWNPTHFDKRLQTGQDLGERMDQAFTSVLQQHTKAVIIGSDCPLLTPEIIQTALDQLDKYDFVLGPAQDGGYYLLGMCQHHSTVFQEIAWSTDAVAQTTLERMAHLGQTCFLLPTLPDIDVEQDWIQYGW